MWKLILFILPLGLDTFAVAAVLGMGGLPRRARLRVSLLMSTFEMAMPIVGLLIGRALGNAIGSAADYIAIGALALLGAWMLSHQEEDENGQTRSENTLRSRPRDNRRSRIDLVDLRIVRATLVEAGCSQLTKD